MNRLIKGYILLLWVLIAFFYGCVKEDTTDKNINNEGYSFLENQIIGGIDTTNMNASLEYPYLIAIGGITVSNNDGNIYMLDADHKKVFAFDSLGNFLNTIGNGYGRGPGEIEFANSITIDSNDRVFVYDYSLRRISVFESTGELISTLGIKVPSKAIVRASEDIWISYLGSKEYQISSMSLTGDTLKYFLPTTERELEFDPYGMSAQFGKTKNNKILVASTLTGIWYELKDQRFQKFGTDLFKDEKALEAVGGVFVSPGTTMAIGELSGNRIAIAYKETKLGEDERPLQVPVKVAVYERSGELLNVLIAPAETEVSRLVYFDNKDNIYFDIQTDSTPVVKRFKIEKSNKAL